MRPHLSIVAAALLLAACESEAPPSPVTVTEPVQTAAQPAAAVPATPPPAPAPSPDEVLEQRVQQALRDTRAVPGQGVDATVAGGVVTLYGTVPSTADRREVGEFVASIGGVASVVNRLVVVQGS